MPLVRNCTTCQRRPGACTCGDELIRAEARAGLIPESISVNSDDTPIGLGGYDRPPEIIENIDEIAARFRENARPQLVCAYCEDTIRTRDMTEAIRWFHDHTCGGEGVSIEEWLASSPTSATTSSA